MKRPQGFDPTPQRARRAPPQAVPAAKGSARVTPLAQPVAAKSQLRAAKRERRSYERSEVRRFTRRSRIRRRRVAAAAAIVLVFAVVVAIAVWSPLLALRQITIVGADRVDEAALREALDDQLGTPLALLDLDEITRQLAAFPLIRSYTTESLPPGTLVVTIVERTPIGAVDDGSHFAVVDPAGVVIESLPDPPEGLPLIDAGDPDVENAAFASAVEVLLALPVELRTRVDSVTATTKDDVAFSLDGGLQTVTWGSADRSALKSRVLAALIATQSATAALEYDVSAPDAPVVRAR